VSLGNVQESSESFWKMLIHSEGIDRGSDDSGSTVGIRRAREFKFGKRCMESGKRVAASSWSG